MNKKKRSPYEKPYQKNYNSIITIKLSVIFVDWLNR